MDKVTEFDPYLDILPEGSMPICAFRCVSYITNEGITKYRMDYSGEAQISQLIGLLEMGKHDVTSKAVDAAKNKDD